MITIINAKSIIFSHDLKNSSLYITILIQISTDIASVIMISNPINIHPFKSLLGSIITYELYTNIQLVITYANKLKDISIIRI